MNEYPQQYPEFYMQLTKAHVIEMSCNQLLLIN